MLTTVSSGTLVILIQFVQFLFYFFSVNVAKKKRMLGDVLINQIAQAAGFVRFVWCSLNHLRVTSMHRNSAVGLWHIPMPDPHS